MCEHTGSVLTDFVGKKPIALIRKACEAIKTDAYLAVLAVLPQKNLKAWWLGQVTGLWGEMRAS
jgi:hypothetical protein